MYIAHICWYSYSYMLHLFLPMPFHRYIAASSTFLIDILPFWHFLSTFNVTSICIPTPSVALVDIHKPAHLHIFNYLLWHPDPLKSSYTYSNIVDVNSLFLISIHRSQTLMLFVKKCWRHYKNNSTEKNMVWCWVLRVT